MANQQESQYMFGKVCRTCKQMKVFTEFYQKQGNRDGYDFRCKSCTLEYQKKINVRTVACSGCGHTAAKHDLSVADRAGRIFCIRCLTPVYYSIDLYNQYILKTIEIEDLQNQMGALSMRLNELERQRTAVVNIVRAYGSVEEKKS